MTTLTKIIVATILSLSLFSCNFDMNFQGVQGNGQVVEDSRTLNASFSDIRVSGGLNVYITQSDIETILVEADENLQDLIITEVENQVLKIRTKKNIGKAASKKVMVNIKNVENIKVSSGSNVYSTNTITSQHLQLESSSGSNMTLNTATKSLVCEASSGSNITLQLTASAVECSSSSGSNITLTGEALKILAEASSGSNIYAGELLSESSHVNASSGSNITVNATEELVAKATSGGGVYYSGNPHKIEKSNHMSGHIAKR